MGICDDNGSQRKPEISIVDSNHAEQVSLL